MRQQSPAVMLGFFVCVEAHGNALFGLLGFLMSLTNGF